MYADVGEVGADLVFVVAEVLGHLLDQCGLDHGLGLRGGRDPLPDWSPAGLPMD